MTRLNTLLCENTNQIRLLLLHFGHAIVGEEWNGKVINPEYTRLYYVTGGSARIMFDNQEIMLEKNNWYLLPAGFSFDFSCKNKLEHIFFHLKLCDFDMIDLLKKCNKPLALKETENKTDFFLGLLESDSIEDGLKIRNTLYSILLKFIEQNHITIKIREFSPCVTHAIHYINQHLSMHLTVSEIAEYACVSKSTLTKHFKKDIKTSINSYIFNTIMSEAEQLLIKSDLSIYAISEKFGFSDQFYFSKRFKEKNGVSPREYRKMTII